MRKRAAARATPVADEAGGGAASPESLCAAYEARAAAQQGRAGRRAQGLFYTPPAVARHVVECALAHGIEREQVRRVVDPCAGAGVLLLAAARALPGAQLCGADLDAEALTVAAQALGLLGPREAPVLAPLDALRAPPPGGPADLLVTNPPYGHAAPRDRARLCKAFPALLGGEVDLYAAFLLRSLALVRPGGCAALLVPDTWMTNARSRRLREEVLAQAELRAVVDLGKPFAAAKDTRVQAVVLVRRAAPGAGSDRPTRAARLSGGALEELAPLAPAELTARARAGFQPYRTEGEKRLCQALERSALPLSDLCDVGYGLRTGDNGRHVVRGAEIPPGGIPLCGGEDVVPFALRWRPKQLVQADAQLLRLADRQLGRPRVAVQRIRTNAAAPWARWLEAAPVPPGLACLDSLSTLSAPPELLWALLGLTASVAWNRWHRLRTTDVNVKPSALRELPTPRALLDPQARAPLLRLSRLRAAQVRGERGPDGGPGLAPRVERALDRLVYQLFGLDEAEVQVAEEGFWGERAPGERARLPGVEEALELAAREGLGEGAEAGVSDPFARVHGGPVEAP